MLMFRLTLILALAACSCGCSSAASNPNALASDLQKALSAGDFTAATKLADVDGAPAELHFHYLSNVLDCSTQSTCTVATAPLDAAFREEWQAGAKALGTEAPAVEGLIVVTMRSKDGSGSGTMMMPYAKIGGSYKVAALHLGAAEAAARRAKSGEELLNTLFAAGIYDNASGARRTDWATAATRLPADGGEPGKALVQATAAMAAAVDAHDPDAAMRSGSQWAKIVFADKGYDGKPIALEMRKRKLQVQALRMLRDVRVSGGYQLGNDAVLLIQARNGIGWVERGPLLISREGDTWDPSSAGAQTVSYPAATP
jgi:hypothetical protein